MKVLKDTGDKQATTIDLQLKKIAELEKIVAEYKSSDISKETVLNLEAALSNQENLYNSVLGKLGVTEKELQANKEKLLKSEKENSVGVCKLAEAQETIKEKEKEIAAHVDLVKKVLEEANANPEIAIKLDKASQTTLRVQACPSMLTLVPWVGG